MSERTFRRSTVIAALRVAEDNKAGWDSPESFETIFLAELNKPEPELKPKPIVGQVYLNVSRGEYGICHSEAADIGLHSLTPKQAGRECMRHLTSMIREAMKYTHKTNAHKYLQDALNKHEFLMI